MFQHLTASGNKAAANRRADILQMCENLGLFSQPTGKDNSQENQPEKHLQQEVVEEPSLQVANQQLGGSEHMSGLLIQQPQYQVEQMQPFYNSDEVFGTLLDHNNVISTVTNDRPLNNQVWDDTYDIYSCYHNDEFALTGAMETDWDELQRQIGRFQ